MRGVAATCLCVWAAAGCTLLAPLDGLTSAASSGGDAASSDGRVGDSPSDDATHDAGPGDAPSPLDHATPTDSPSPPGDATGDSAPPSPTGFRRAITVTAKDAVGTGYAVAFALDTQSLVTAGKALSSLDDVRIVDGAGNARDRVVDAPDTTASTVWFSLSKAVAAGASDTYFLEYGHPDAGAAPASGANVFAFYDDFQGTQLASHWLVQGTPTVSNGTLRLHAWTATSTTNPDSLTTNAQLDGVPAASAVDIVATVTNPASPADSVNGFWYWLGYQHQGDFTADAPWILWIARHADQVWAEDVVGDASFTGPVVPQDTAAHDYVVARAPSQTVFSRDGTSQYTAGLANVTDYSLMLRNYAPQTDVLVTRVRARPLVDHEPGVSLGPEQSAP